jgi:ribosomal protein L21E
MVKRFDGARKRSRHKMKKCTKRKGKISTSAYFQQFKEGDKVALKAEPAYQKGMYPLRFHGRIGTVGNKSGRCYEVKVEDGKMKTFIVHPVHLIKV